MPEPTPPSLKCASERSAGVGVSVQPNQPFETWPGNLRFTAPAVYTPESRAELVHAILQAEATGQRVRAYGSKWSFSDAVVASSVDRPGVMISTERLNKNLDVLLLSILPAGADPTRFSHVEAGRKARDLIRDVGARGLMMEAGGASGQSVGGMMATSTHSSESSVPPFVDYVRAIHLIGAGGIEHWIERDQPITDPVKLRERYPCLAEGNIRYDTRLFDAVLVAAGSMGVIYSVIVEPVPATGFRRHRFATTWERLLQEDPDLERVMSGAFMQEKFERPPIVRTGTGDILQRQSFMVPPFAPNVFSQIVINPYPFYANDNTLTGQERLAIGHHLCFVTNRVRIPFWDVTPGPESTTDFATLGVEMGQAAKDALNDPGQLSNFLQLQNHVNGLSNVSDKAAYLVDFLVRHNYQPGTISAALHALLVALLPLGDSTETSTSEVMSWKDDEPLRAFCVEAAFPLKTGIAYTNQVLDMAFNYAERSPRVYVGGYLALRITGRKTAALLGMQQWTPTLHVEYMGIAGTAGLSGFVLELQTRATALGGILHFGLQNDAMTASDLRTAFGSEAIEAFRRARGVLSHNGALTTFDNSFTERLGLSARRTDLSYLVPLLLSGT